MRSSTVVAAVLIGAVVCASCGGSDTPVSPTATQHAGPGGTPPGESPAAGTESVGTPVSLTGVIRGLNARTGTFSLVTRAGIRTVLTDGETEVWRRGTRVRPATLADGQSVSIRGYDHTRYVLARAISIN